MSAGGVTNGKYPTSARTGLPVPSTCRVPSGPGLEFAREAEFWEYLADRALALHFKECNTAGSSDLAKSGVSSDANETRWETVAAT